MAVLLHKHAASVTFAITGEAGTQASVCLAHADPATVQDELYAGSTYP